MSRFNIEPKLTENAKFIASKRYLKIDDDGNPLETPRELFARIAKFIAKAENELSDKKKNYKKLTKNEIEKVEDAFFEIQANLEFLSGMSLLDRGKEDLVAACYVMPIHDSVESIYGTLANTTTLHRRGAGIGYDWSEVRPEGTKVKSTGREASGPISFMRLYDFSSETIMNRGSQRHAGHMGILRIDHPDIQKFITAKQDYTQLTNFNISVAITDEFVKALKQDDEFSLKFDNKIYGKVNAKNLLRQIITSIHASGEPGFIFIDEVNRHNPTPHVGKMTATNQCGEQPLLPYEACNLGSVVLSKFFISNKSTKIEDKIDWERLEYVTKTGVRFLDNTITVSNHLLPDIEKIVKFGNRKIGMGVMGWADLLYLLEVPYDSEKALELAEKIMKFINEKSREASEELGRIRGDFGNFKGSTLDKQGYKNMRNATVTTIAPNGTTSLLADVNGGIEPIFALAYIRKNMETVGEDTEMVFANLLLEEKLKKEWLYSKELMQKVAKAGTLQEIKEIPESIKKVFVCSYDIAPEWHVKMQGAFQKYTDNAVSKTINLPESSGAEEVEDIFMQAVKENLKGLTIYRDKSRDKQVLSIK
ncbi:MAG: Ribonucleoside-diphosphate reductase [candidate division WS6 bacterium GW2011_GWA2_37_6]|uniref:Vitamin B12-dependent ribonucleotide reductase n=1 Tax=candidate division WS6 bacterium GW2011_GWA2_37_6 TaxID=1619087 RepID=A0A0G0HCA4_9BACT|nr:MAG: Ribonucleoside-diphosphate reductase [candidate division WS6 bacterium GW2011_GWA2_37_6]